MANSKSRLILLFFIYLFSYWLLASLATYLALGYEGAWDLISATPVAGVPETRFNAKWMLISSLLASICCFATTNTIFNKANFKEYIIVGFIIGNLSILILCFFMLLETMPEWNIRNLSILLVTPYIGLFVAYMSSAALIAVGPSTLSAWVIYWIQARKLKG